MNRRGACLLPASLNLAARAPAWQVGAQHTTKLIVAKGGLPSQEKFVGTRKVSIADRRRPGRRVLGGSAAAPAAQNRHTRNHQRETARLGNRSFTFTRGDAERREDGITATRSLPVDD